MVGARWLRWWRARQWVLGEESDERGPRVSRTSETVGRGGGAGDVLVLLVVVVVVVKMTALLTFNWSLL